MKYGVVSLVLTIVFISGCMEPAGTTINLSKTEMSENTGVPVVVLGVASRISPEQSYYYYNQMSDYIEKQLRVPVKMIEVKNYSLMNEMIKKGEVQGAFICSGAYVEGSEDSGMKNLAIPVYPEKYEYRSYIIVHKNSSFEKFSDLRGRKFAFMDPLSNTGYMYPLYRLKLINETPDSFFGKGNYFFSFAHDDSIFAVAEGLAEGASVDGIVFKFMEKKRPEITGKVKIIEKSRIFGTPPFVVSNHTDILLALKLKRVLLNMHRDEAGREILANMGIVRFSEAKDSDYDELREMMEVALEKP